MPIIFAGKRNLSIQRKQSGFSLIEVMVTALILSTSMLGIAQLQATSMKNSHDAHFRSTANTLAYEIVDRMRANRTISSTTINYAISIGTTITASNCETNSCTPAQLSGYDLEAWKYLLATNLPGGDGAISVAIGTTGAEVTVTVQWKDNDSAGNRNNYRLNISTLL
ncbi:MAG: type IV pilus modification protein PilV [Pseudomonadales bacterium]|nr:type IV pilus modification protein PilV [Pseudomonadales bacterium]